MNIIIKHIPVMKQEVIRLLNIKKNGIYIDSTFGTGGHSLAILKKIGKYGKLYSFDKDPYAILIGKKIQDQRFLILQENFINILNYSVYKNIAGKVDGILFDLGTSSLQIDDQERGFSFKKNGPLDMRMNQNIGISASDWLFKSNTNKISCVLKKYGEERFSRKIAHAIINYQKKQKIQTTFELVNIIKKSIPINNKFKHPAKRTFQAIRIYINQELQNIQIGLENSLKILKPGGRLLVISFHSLEDRIVKQFMIHHSQKATIPYGMPITEKQIYTLNKRPLKIIQRTLPKYEEITNNPRSRSAVLRVAELKKKYEKIL